LNDDRHAAKDEGAGQGGEQAQAGQGGEQGQAPLDERRVVSLETARRALPALDERSNLGLLVEIERSYRLKPVDSTARLKVAAP
jgi:hypothetical protein